jgi:hypothetical protein
MNDIRLAQMSIMIRGAREDSEPYAIYMIELFDEVMEQRKKVKEMQKAFETIHGIASETFESHNQLELIRLTAVEYLKGDTQ